MVSLLVIDQLKLNYKCGEIYYSNLNVIECPKQQVGLCVVSQPSPAELISQRCGGRGGQRGGGRPGQNMSSGEQEHSLGPHPADQ